MPVFIPVVRSIGQNIGRIAIWSLAVLLSLSTALVFIAVPAGNYAIASEPEEIVVRIADLKKIVKSAKNEYISAVQVSEENESQIEELEKQQEELSAELDEKRERLSAIIVHEYKSPTIQSVVFAIGEAKDLETVLRQLEYASAAARDRARTASDIRNTGAEISSRLAELEMRKSQSTQISDDAEYAKKMYQEELEAARGEISIVQEKYLKTAESASGQEQLSAVLSYLETTDEATRAQIALVKSAYSTGYAGSARCEAWAEEVYRNAGYSIKRYAGAAQCTQALTRSTDLSEIPVGALVFGSGSGSAMGKKWGHVGICVSSGSADGEPLIMDNEASRTGKAVPLGEWSRRQTSVSWVSGKQGAFAWGYPDSVRLGGA